MWKKELIIMNRGSLIIVPDENKILKSVIKEDIMIGESHNTGIDKFVKKYYPNNLNIDMNDYNGAPSVVADLGHLVIKTEDDVSLIVFYIPNVITDNQINWFLENKYKFQNYQMCSAISLRSNFNEELNGIEKVEEELRNKNIVYTRLKEGDNNVRNKI